MKHAMSRREFLASAGAGVAIAGFAASRALPSEELSRTVPIVYDEHGGLLVDVLVNRAFAIVQPGVGYFAEPDAVGFLGNSVLDRLDPFFDYAGGVFGIGD